MYTLMYRWKDRTGIDGLIPQFMVELTYFIGGLMPSIRWVDEWTEGNDGSTTLYTSFAERCKDVNPVSNNTHHKKHSYYQTFGSSDT